MMRFTQYCTFWTENLHSFAPSGRDFFFSPNSAPLRREFRDLLRKLSRLAYGLFKHRIAFRGDLPKAVSYSSQILKVKFFTLDDDELVDPSFQN